MEAEAVAALLAGSFGVLGTLGGVGLSTWMGRRAEVQRLREQDARRWQADRRATYGAFLLLADSMLREIDRAAAFLSYDGTAEQPEEDDRMRSDGLFEYLVRWDDELQPALVEVQLLASATVADLADRVSGALMEITGEIESNGAFVAYYPRWFRARDLLGVLRNAMRDELGLPDSIDAELPRRGDWPWLDDRPTEEDYIRRQAEIPGRPPLTDSEAARMANKIPVRQPREGASGSHAEHDRTPRAEGG